MTDSGHQQDLTKPDVVSSAPPRYGCRPRAVPPRGRIDRAGLRYLNLNSVVLAHTAHKQQKS